MKIYNIISVSIFMALLTACATRMPAAPPWAQLTDPAVVAAATQVTHDDYKKLTTFVGANSSQYRSIYLRGWRDDKTKVETFQLYVTVFYSTPWRFYNEAYDSDGTRLNFTSIDRKVDSCGGTYGCNLEEIIGLNVSRKYLEEHQETGIRYKVSGKIGEFADVLPAAYIKGFLVSVDAPAVQGSPTARTGPVPWYQTPVRD